MRLNPARLMALFTLGLLSFSANATLDQFQLDGSDQNQGIHSVRQVGQTFTAGLTGQLTGLELSLFELGDGPGLTIDIFDFAGGDLSSTPSLGSVTIQETDLGPSPLTLTQDVITATFIDLSALSIDVTAGDVLGFRLSSDRVLNPVGQPLFAVRIAFGNPYAGGGFFVGTDFAEIGGVGLDAAFQTFVRVPEPASLMLLATGLVCVGVARRGSGGNRSI